MQNFQAALLRIGFSSEQVGGITEGINAIMADADRIGTAFGKMFGAENLTGVDAVVAAFDNIASAVTIIANSVEAVERVFNAISNSGAGKAAAAIGSAIQITPSEVVGNFNTLQAASATPFTDINQVQGGGGKGIAPSLTDLNALTQAIISAFQTVPPPVVNVSNTLDGKEIATSVSNILGSQAQSLNRIGGNNSMK